MPRPAVRLAVDVRATGRAGRAGGADDDDVVLFSGVTVAMAVEEGSAAVVKILRPMSVIKFWLILLVINIKFS